MPFRIKVPILRALQHWKVHHLDCLYFQYPERPLHYPYSPTEELVMIRTVVLYIANK